MENMTNIKSAIRQSTADMVTIDIKDSHVEVTEVTPENKPSFTKFEQEGMCTINGEYRRIILSLKNEQSGFDVGAYEVDFGKSIEVDNYGAFRFKRNLHLTRV